MTRSVLAFPVRVVRVGGKVAKRLAFPVLAVGLIRKVVQRPASSPAARVTPDPGPVAAPTPKPPAAKRSDAAPPEPEPVIDPVPLAEPAVDLDVDVTLPSELPIRSYDALAAADAERAIRELVDADEVRAVLHFEEENAKRADVLTAAREHLAVLAGAPSATA